MTHETLPSLKTSSESYFRVCCILVIVGLTGCNEENPGVVAGLNSEGGESIATSDGGASAWDLDGNFQVVLERPGEGSVFTEGFSIDVQGAVVHPSEDLSTLRLEVVSRNEGTLAVLNPEADGSFGWTWELAYSREPDGSDSIQVLAFDSVGAVAVVESNISINTLPEIPVFELTPTQPRTEDDVEMTVLTLFDKELAAVGSLPTYSTVWRKLNSETVVEGDVLPSTSTQRGDVWVVEVVASDSYGASVPASQTVSIYNTPPTLSAVVLEREGDGVESVNTCLPVGVFDADSDTVEFKIRWYSRVEGGSFEELDNAEPSLIPSEALMGGNEKRLWKGDDIQCRITPFDGFANGLEGVSSIGTIKNSIPTISTVQLLPEQPRITDSLNCFVGDLLDDDPEDQDTLVGEVRWLVNGDVRGTDPVLPGTSHIRAAAVLGAEKGDEVQCEVVVEDGDGGQGIGLSPTRPMINAVPEANGIQIVAQPAPPTAASDLSCSFDSVEDPDGDLVSTIVFWIVNNHDVLDGGAKITGNPLSSPFFEKGDSVRCGLLMDDGNEFVAAIQDSEVVIGNSPPVLAGVSLVPSEPTRQSVMKCLGEGFSDLDASDQPEVWSYPDPSDTGSPGYLVEWFADGELVEEATAAAWLPSAYPPGTDIQCSIRAFDGLDYSSSILSAPRTLGNTPPLINEVVLTPEIGHVNSTYECLPSGAMDPDGDGVELVYTWTLNGTTVPGATASVLGSSVAIGDTLQCTVTPYDGYVVGTSVNSAILTVENQAPSLESVALVFDTEDGLPVLRCDTGEILDGDGLEGTTVSYLFTDEEDSPYKEKSPLPFLTLDELGDSEFVRCTATPSDGVGDGLPMDTGLLSIFELEPKLFSVTIGPEPLTVSTGGACAAVTSPLGANGEVLIQWLRNGELLESVDATLSGVSYAKGEELVCVATLLWNGVVLDSSVASVVVGNAPPSKPEFSIVPASVGPNTSLVCDWVGGGIDPDGDVVSVSVVWLDELGSEVATGVELSGAPACSTRTCQGNVQDGEDWAPVGEPISTVIGEYSGVAFTGMGYGEILTGGIDFPISGGEFTIEMSVRAKDNQESVLLEHTSGYGLPDAGFGVWITPAGNLAFIRVEDGETAEVFQGGGGEFPVNVWTHTAVSYSGNTLRLWVNGTVVGSFTLPNISLQSTEGVLRIGGSSSVTDVGWFGDIRNLRFSSVDRLGTGGFAPEVLTFLQEPEDHMFIDFDGGSDSGECVDKVTGSVFSVTPSSGQFFGGECTLP